LSFIARDVAQEELESFRSQAMALLSIAGLAGLPQISLPVAILPDGAGPVGLSLIARRGADEQLLALVEQLASECDPLLASPRKANVSAAGL
jgi:amidase